MAKKIDIGGELHSTATGNIVADAKEIKYRPTGKEEKTQAQVNDELIEAVGSGGGVDARIASAVNAAKAEIKGNATSACDTLGEAEALISAETSARQSAISNVIGDAASDYNTLGKLEDKIQAEATRAEAAEGALDGRVDTLEDAVGTGGSVDSRISAAVAIETTRAQQAESSLSTGKADKATTLAGYGITDAYTKTEINDHIDTPNQGYITAVADSNTTTANLKSLIDTAAGSDKEKADFIYRVGCWDGSQYNDTMYSEYAWIDTDYVFLSKKSQIDEVFDISAYHANTSYVDLAAALNGGANIPQSLQKGGMSVKFVQSSDNKYVQYRLMSDTFNTDITKWQNVGDFLEEKEHPIADNEVAGYLTDKNKSIIAKLMKNGAVEWLVENSKDIANNARFENIEDFLSYVSSEVLDSGNGIIKYLTDKNGFVIATIDNVGITEFKGGGGFDGEITSPRNISFDAIKVITDRKGSVIGWINSNGRVHIEELEVSKLQVNGGSDIGLPQMLFPVLGIVSSGVKPREMVNDKTYNLLEAFPSKYVKNGSNVSSIPCITLYDDDAIDEQLPTSSSKSATDETAPSLNSKGYGYASLLFPLIHAFNMKYKDEILGKVTCFEAAEGQRIGLTKLYSYGDEFTGELNNNGKVLNKLIELGEWETVCHSMTARYTSENYLVNGLDSNFANEVLANGVWDGDLNHGTTVCYDTVTKKNYQIKQDKSGWTEIPNHYAKPYCAVSRASNSQLVINPTYSVKYQVDEWFKRADIAGLSYSMKDVGKRVYANWGTSHSIWHIRQNLKYADYGFGGSAVTNTIPLDTVVHRFSWAPSVSINKGTPYYGYSGSFNVYTEAEYQRLVDMIDTCVESKGWSFLGSHNYTSPSANYYLSNLLDFTYGEYSHANLYEEILPQKPAGTPENLYYYDPDYPEEWQIPLKYAELQDIIGDNVHDYINHPPSRLNISSWDEWYPCPGTGMALLWDALRYAVSKGVRFITAKEGFERFGNLLTIGYKFTNGETFSQDKRLGNIPEESKAHCIIGANGSVFFND